MFSKQFKLDASENYAWMNVGDDWLFKYWSSSCINGDGKTSFNKPSGNRPWSQAPAVNYS